jgi:glycosyltransferase involved in cell wall biosynthesis
VTVPDATIVITTHNRRNNVRRAIESALSQTAAVEVLVIDDGSIDGTPSMVANEFPEARLHRSETSLGYVVQRNVAARLASAPVIISIDDDAVLSSPLTVAQTLEELNHPQVGAVAIPVIDVRHGPTVRARAPSRAPDRHGVYVVPTFIGTANAIRRDLFVRLGGYRDVIFHQGEEADYCVRMLAAGYVTRLGSADPIYHYESQSRDVRRMDIYGSRNMILFCWHNEPLPYAALRMLEVTLKGLAFGIKIRRPYRKAYGLALGYAACWHERTRRTPVSSSVSRLNRELRRSGCLPLDRIESRLPKPLAPDRTR